MEKRIPRRRFKEFVGSGDWEEKKFGDIFPTIKSGNRLPKDLLKEGNIPYVIATVENNGVFMKIDKNTLDYHGNNMKLFEAPSITFSIDNPDAIFLQEQAFFTSNIMRVLNNEDLSKNEYIFFLELLRKLTGGFDWSIKFSGPVVLNLDIRIPYDRERKNINYKEIQKIGDFFQKLDRLIEINKDKLDKLKASKSAYLTEMFPREGEDRPRRRFQGFTGAWEEKKLGEVVEYIIDNRGKNPRYMNSGDIPVIDNYMIKNKLYPNLEECSRFIDQETYKNFIRKYSLKDDILITLVGNGIGNITLCPNNKCVIVQNTLGLRVSAVKEFIFYTLIFNNKNILLLDRGMAQPSIRQDELLDFNILIPSLAEQEKIGDFFQKLDQQIGLQKEKLEKLEKMKKAYLAEMFV